MPNQAAEDVRDAPATTLAADGKTTLHRFHVVGVMYAPTRSDAEARIAEIVPLYMDRAFVV